MKKHNKGFTLAEVLLATAMVAVIIGALAFMFQVVVGSYSTQGSRAGSGASATKAIREMVKELRIAKEAGNIGTNEIRYTMDGNTYYVYYFYNSTDIYPPNFNRTSYQIRKAAISGKIDGTFAYGSGDLIARDILPPPASGLSITSPFVTIDLTVRRGNNTMRSASMVRMRNI